MRRRRRRRIWEESFKESASWNRKTGGGRRRSVDTERKRDRGGRRVRECSKREKLSLERRGGKIVGTERKHTKRGEAEGVSWHVGN